MVKETDSGRESQVQEAEPEIIASGDAILVASALDRIADALQRFADKLGELNQGGGDDDENPPDTYLDGKPRRK